MSGPAAPYNYTGKFVPESDIAKYRDDPIALGRLYAERGSVDEPLYRKRDPRLTSKTVVVRDYACKLPIDLVDAERIATAVLKEYPDTYVSFLGHFVSNLFDASMHSYLGKLMAGYNRLIEQPDELNRVSWGAYMTACGSDKEGEEHLQDVTLAYNKQMKKQLQKLTTDGRAMAGQVTSQDVYDLRPCLRQHIETLRMMRDEWCRGFQAPRRSTCS